jgi:SPASM domain peptide maturase of grasp-with-spasm system
MRIPSKNRVKLYPNIIPTKGYNRSTLIDLLYGNIYLVPNSFVDYLESNADLSSSDEESEILEEYRTFILENELGIEVSEDIASNLKELSATHHPYSKLTNSILELDSNSDWNLKHAIQQLDSCSVQFLEIRFLDYEAFIQNSEKIRLEVEFTTIESIHLFIPFHPNLKKFLETYLIGFVRLFKITIYNVSVGFELENGFNNLVFTRQEEITHTNCGHISTTNFVISTSSYVKNQHFNSCLAHKVSIDKDGFICNCPSLNSRYGKMDSAKLSEVLDETNFRSSWSLTKDKIAVCSLCEFRWVCPDCRAFTTDDKLLGKPLKCGYNPFINLWKGEENYLSEEECGVVYDANELVINEFLLESINQKIWG